jgi:hypothetical protein
MAPSVGRIAHAGFSSPRNKETDSIGLGSGTSLPSCVTKTKHESDTIRTFFGFFCLDRENLSSKARVRKQSSPSSPHAERDGYSGLHVLLPFALARMGHDCLFVAECASIPAHDDRNSGAFRYAAPSRREACRVCLARGEPLARLTREAVAVLERCKSRRPARPYSPREPSGARKPFRSTTPLLHTGYTVGEPVLLR